jgi:parallel beta-helix repeat protein
MQPSAQAEVNSAAFQRCLNDTVNGPVTIPGADGEYLLAGRITVPAGRTIVLGDGARLRWLATEPASGGPFLRFATRPGLEVLGDEFHLTGRGQILGPSRGAYTALEIGLLCVGNGIDAVHRGFEISDGIEFRDWGSHGIALQFVRDVRIRGISVRECGYAGMQFLSCETGHILSNTVSAIGPGASGNAYGISCTHDSFNYAADPNAASDGRRAANRFCIDFEVAHNTVQDIPLWAGIDFHGAYDCRAHDNQVYNCRHGMMLQGSSGNAVDFAGENNSVESNSVTTRRLNGEPTTVTALSRLGISVNGGKIVHNRAISIKNNAIDGYGDARHTSFSLQHTFTSNLEISRNQVTNWQGYGCYSAYSDGVIDANVFGPVAEPAGSACIFVAIGGGLRITGNRLDVDSGSPPEYGLYLNTTRDAPYLVEGNDFRAATVRPYAGPRGVPLLPNQVVGGRPG